MGQTVSASRTPSFKRASFEAAAALAGLTAVRSQGRTKTVPAGRWSFAGRLPQLFSEVRTPGSRQGDSSLTHRWALPIAEVARRSWRIWICDNV